jgi:uncharacterized membrane protein YdcZ (DUF606 family)
MQRIPGVILLLVAIWLVRSGRNSDSTQERNWLFILAGAMVAIFIYQLYHFKH